MALIKCSECSKEISSKAKSCPNCGNPIEEEKPLIKKRISIIHKKMGFLGSGVNIFVYIDNQMVGRTSSGKTLDLELPVGKHYISLEMPVNQANNNSSNISKDTKEFTILESTNEVYITISIKLGWSEGTCNIDEILCR